MSTAALSPLDETITIADLTRDPYPIHKRLRREAPVLHVKCGPHVSHQGRRPRRIWLLGLRTVVKFQFGLGFLGLAPCALFQTALIWLLARTYRSHGERS